MMKDSRKLNKKIHAVAKIAKITNAMKIVAAMKIKKLSQEIKQSQNVFIHLKMILGILNKIYLMEKPRSKFSSQNKTFWIIYTSDLGLCGGYNTQMFHQIENSVKSQDYLFVVGKKGINYFKFKNRNLFDSISSEKFGMFQIETIVQKIIQGYLKKWNRVAIVFSEQVENFKIEPTVKTLLPVDFSQNAASSTLINEFLVEPEISTVYKNAEELFLKINLYNFFQKARLTEEISRRLSMESANENAKEMIEDLKLKYNQIRQENITREILEISEN